MKLYIREHLKEIICITLLLLCTGVIVTTSATIAKIQPVLSEELRVISFELEKQAYDYTGKAVKPEIKQVIFEDKDNNRIEKKSDEVRIVKYIDNTEIGQADVEIALNGYQKSILIENAFSIRPPKVKDIQVTTGTDYVMELSWSESAGADGYMVYRSADGGRNYMPIHQVKTEEALSYQDTQISHNAVYTYYVSAYKMVDDIMSFSVASDEIKYYTPLDTPVISSVKPVSYDTLQIQWNAVEGAAGYQLFKSDKENGEYKCIAEITDAGTTVYNNAGCECGKTYYYYVKACQVTEFETLYGEASAIVSGRTNPNGTSLSGSSTEGNTKVTLSWKKVSGAQGYEVYKNGKLVKTIDSADILTWSESGLSKEAEASYKVRAYCVKGNEKLYGSYSKTYEKEVTITYNYGEVSSEVSAVTQYAGRSYVYGGTSPTKGWDCSGFTQYVYKKHFGVSLPRTSGEQVGRGTTVSKNNRSSWQPGDLLFYKEGGRVSHVAIYLGNGQMIHALNSKYDTLIQGVDHYEKWDSKTSIYCVKRIIN